MQEEVPPTIVERLVLEDINLVYLEECTTSESVGMKSRHRKMGIMNLL